MSNEMANIMDLAKGLQQSAAQADDGAGSFMKFTKHGEWVWGTEDTETEESSLWLVHPQAFKHGWIAWGDAAHDNYGEKLGEVSIPATEPLPLESSLDDVKGNWAKQISMQLMCIEGLDGGVRVTFNSNSVGGRKAYSKVVNEVIAKITSGDPAVCPVIQLMSDSYVHPKFKKIYTPVIKIVDWKTLKELNANIDSTALEDKSGANDDDDEAELTPAELKAAAKAELLAELAAEAEAEAAAAGDDADELTPAEIKAAAKAELKAEMAAEAKAEAKAKAKKKAAAELAAESAATPAEVKAAAKAAAKAELKAEAAAELKAAAGAEKTEKKDEPTVDSGKDAGAARQRRTRRAR